VTAAGVGACYWAQDPLGAFVEVFRATMLLDLDAEVSARRLARVAFASDLRLADLWPRRALRFGVTAEVGAGGDYGRSQAFAADAATAGFDGIRCYVRHDPAQRLVGVVLFGAAGAPAPGMLPDPVSSELTSRLLDEARRKFGYVLLPRP